MTTVVNPYAPITTVRPAPPSVGVPVGGVTKKEAKAERRAEDAIVRGTSVVTTQSPYDRPRPPEVTSNGPITPLVVEHKPRYFYSPSWPVYIPSNPQPLPFVNVSPPPSGPRQVGMNEVSSDPVGLLAEKGRLRKAEKHSLWFTTYPQVSVAEAKSTLASGGQVLLAPDSGMHEAKTYQSVNAGVINGMLPGLRNDKLGELQGQANQVAANARSNWNEQDVQNREATLPAFNSVFNMEQLNQNDMMMSSGSGKSVNRLLITAMNLYAAGDTRREIATQWHNNPNMSKQEFSQMANSVVVKAAANLGWNAGFSGDWDTYLGQNPVPGLRYPDTDKDVEYNQKTIAETAQKLMYTLPSAVSNR